MVDASAEAPLLKLAGVTKRFGGVTALDGVDLDLQAGEIHALLGEKGAGKSTLIKILGGIHLPDAGRIEIDGQAAAVRGVADADRLGIRIIHQELTLAPNLSVAENIYLGREPATRGILQRGKMFRRAERLVRALGLDAIRDVRAPVCRLPIAQRQLVEIARALSCRARIMVLDEPTSSLSEAETEALFATLRRLRAQGVGIIYISHRLDEILRLSDRITVLRDGHSVGTQRAGDVNRQQLVRWMVGREIAEHFHRPGHRPRGVALEVRHLENASLHDVSLCVQRGEVVGIAGLVGSGRSELARAIFGIDRLDRGTIAVDGKPVSIRSPRDALRAGIVLAPEDRQREGLSMGHSVAFNAVLPWLRQWITGPIVRPRRRRAIVERLVEGFSIQVADPEQPIESLSGGNQQKVLVGRWMERRPKVLILDEPTRGIDVGAREEMFSMIGTLVESGMAVLLISSDLAEVVNTSHRIAIYRHGRILDTVAAEDTTLEAIMEQLTGADVDAHH